MSNFTYENIPCIQELTGLHGTYNVDNVKKDCLTLAEREEKKNKIVDSLETAIKASGLKDGMTISFHHHFRGGDYIVNMVMDKLAEMGFKNLVVAASSLADCHKPLIKHIENGVIRRIETSGLRGELAERISRGLMEAPVVFRSHGGRAAAIASGELHIDVAFLGAPSCDPFGNANGYVRYDETGEAVMCGSLGYARPDALYAGTTIIITNNIVPYPNLPCAIPATDVDYIVEVEEIGDPKGIMQGATRYTKAPKELMQASTCAKVLEAAGLLKDGFSMQMGTGGASLAVARYLRELMVEKGITASFALGGITGQMVEMHEEGLIKNIIDVQGFDLQAAKSLKENHFHSQISAEFYASYADEGSAVNQLDFVVLSALEVDTDFNVNVLTGSDGVIRGAIGGHPDTAAGAYISVVTVPLVRGRIPCVVDKVGCVVTPGKTVDVVVTEYGVAVNPLRPELEKKLNDNGIKTVKIEELKEKALGIVGTPDPIEYLDKIVAVVCYRDNTVIDVVRQIKE